ncbi:MAG: serine hydroxymethyltransferase [Deltaproteobacteria bacterium]|jgi:glycine hydroxymethyltransferase
MRALSKDDPQIASLALKELDRLETTLDLIAAENHAPPSILEALGSVFSTKTIEGYPGNRYHAGCKIVDEVERLAISRAKALFGADHVNVQPHSGTSANLAVYFSVLKPGDKILSMTLSHGGHLSHGHPASIAGKCFQVQHYGVDPKTGRIDYQKVAAIAKNFKPRMIVAGASSYPRCIDYGALAETAASLSAYFMVDMAHIGGLVAAGVIPSPVPLADFVTFTCYKTMMGGRGGVILCREGFSAAVDRSVFPGCQGTSPVNAIAAKAVIFKLAMESAFVHIQKQTVANAQKLAALLAEKDYAVITGGTDTHQVIVDLSPLGIDGATAETALEKAGIILNKNVIPRDQGKASRVSGIRIGTAAVAARGMGENEMPLISDWLDRGIRHPKDSRVLAAIRSDVAELCGIFPVYGQRMEVGHDHNL